MMPPRVPRPPMTNIELEGKYRKAAFFINRGMTKIHRIEAVVTALVARTEAAELALLYLLDVGVVGGPESAFYIGCKEQKEQFQALYVFS